MTSSRVKAGINIKVCSVVLTDLSKSKMPLMNKKCSDKVGSDSSVGDRRKGATTTIPNGGCRSYTLSFDNNGSEVLKEIQTQREETKTVTGIEMDKISVKDENHLAEGAQDDSENETEEESNRPSSAMSGSSTISTGNKSDASGDSMFLPITVDKGHESSRKRTYDQTISDDSGDEDYIPIIVKKSSEATASDYSSGGTTEEEEVDEEYIVEKILASRIKGGRRYYYVKWQGYSSGQNTWEPESNMTGCRELINEYKRKCQTKPQAITSAAKKCRQNPNIQLTSISNTCGNFVVENANPSSAKGNSAKNSSNRSDSVSRGSGRAKMLNRGSPIIAEVKEHQSSADIIREPETVIEVERIYPVDRTSVFIVRVWENEEVYLLPIDISMKLKADKLYNLIITENIHLRRPQWVYGASLDVNGNVYCLVKFEGFDYVDIVAPGTLFQEFPYLASFYAQSKYSMQIQESLSSPAL